MFGWKALLDLISQTLNYSEAKRPALAARVQMLQKPPYSFPPTKRVGRGGRTAYTLEQALQLIYYFKLLEVGVPPAHATRLIQDEWRMLASATGDSVISPGQYPYGNFLVVHLRGGDVFRDPETKRSPNPREANPEGPFRSDRPILHVLPSELLSGLASTPDWFDCAALIHIPSITKALSEHLVETGVGTSELLSAAHEWVEA